MQLDQKCALADLHAQIGDHYQQQPAIGDMTAVDPSHNEKRELRAAALFLGSYYPLFCPAGIKEMRDFLSFSSNVHHSHEAELPS